MAASTGFFDNTGSPRIKIRLHGVSDQFAKEFDAIIDTGFSGFVSISLLDALPLGLVLVGTATTTLADGSTSPKLTALGNVKLGTDERLGVVLLNMGSGPTDVLLGMEFLQAFDKTLLVHKTIVVLIDTPPAPAASPPAPATQI